MTNEGKWTIVVGCDDAGVAYKDQLKADLEKDPRVARVIDVGVPHDGDKTAYPHVAVDAARKVAKGEADRALLICGTGESAVCAKRGVRAQAAGLAVKRVKRVKRAPSGPKSPSLRRMKRKRGLGGHLSTRPA